MKLGHLVIKRCKLHIQIKTYSKLLYRLASLYVNEIEFLLIGDVMLGEGLD